MQASLIASSGSPVLTQKIPYLACCIFSVLANSQKHCTNVYLFWGGSNVATLSTPHFCEWIRKPFRRSTSTLYHLKVLLDQSKMGQNFGQRAQKLPKKGPNSGFSEKIADWNFVTFVKGSVLWILCPMALSDSPAHPPMGRFPQSHLSKKTSVPRDQGFVKSSSTLQIAVMSSSDLRARMDGLEGLSKADAVYPEPLSRHNRSPIVAQQVGRPSNMALNISSFI